MSVLIILLGFGVGVLVGLFGIGGGIVLVPALVYLARMDQHLAQGTSLFILLPPLGLGALFTYWKNRDVDLRAGILCALGILAGSYLGSSVAIPMTPQHLQGAFGCFVMFSSFLLWRRARQAPAAEAAGKAEQAGG